MNASGTPRNAVITMAVAALVITLPALKGNSAGDPFPFAFFAVVSITVIGLYIAYAIPIYLRWRRATRSSSRRRGTSATSGAWMNPFAVIWVGMITIIFCLPFTPAAVPWNDEYSWEALNYAPLTVGAVFLFAAIAWKLRAQATTSPARSATSTSTQALTAEEDRARDEHVTSSG